MTDDDREARHQAIIAAFLNEPDDEPEEDNDISAICKQLIERLEGYGD